MLGAGDQGMMFGYATDENEELMPYTLILARNIIQTLKSLRKKPLIDDEKNSEENSDEEKVDWLLPDAKSQVTLQYEEDTTGHFIPTRIHTIVISTQHTQNVTLEDLRSFIISKVIPIAVPSKLLTASTRYLINSTGSFILGGPKADAGLTGRKIIVDGYGGWGSHGGGAFSGKDASKVDRSGAYFARFVAKSLVASKACKRCLIQIAYCIGHTKPLSIFVNTYGTGIVSDEIIEKFLHEGQVFDFRPGKIIERLNLKTPVFKQTAKFGHFGWNDERFEWEKVQKIDLEMLKNLAKK